ncbi:hypothetical protein [Sphingobium sp. BS19]|uniref:hypothetical protein n=1 Tax=Sphingobium sp. BS19 TaxID=3018973 RepID=UPI0022EF2376|nr:hypothetical protein [Sphingobium sp. BS19]GLI99095.1 hypothetical protein Sbs19_29130 [Sphingobium sp. BS19]
MAASTATVPETMEGLRRQNSAYRALCASMEAIQATYTEQGRKYQEAITTLDSEREANAILTKDIERLREALQKIYDLPGELNLANYDGYEVRELNENFVEALLIAEAALGTPS